MATNDSKPGPSVSFDTVQNVDAGLAKLLPGLRILRDFDNHTDTLLPLSKPRPSQAARLQSKHSSNLFVMCKCSAPGPTKMYMIYLVKLFQATGFTLKTFEVEPGTHMEMWVPKKPGLKAHKTPLLMLHGFGADSTMQFDGQVTVLSKTFDLYFPNFIFFGGSTTTNSERSMTWQADCALKALEMAGVDPQTKVDVLGFSYGSAVLYKLAQKYPHKIRRIVLGDEGVMMNAKDMEEMQLAEGIDDGTGFWKLPTTPGECRKLEEMAYSNPLWVPDIIYEDVLETLFVGNAKEWSELVVEYTVDRPDDPNTNMKLPHETLLIWGEHDPMAPLRFAKMLRRHFGDSSRLVIFQGAKHMCHSEFPKEWNAVVTNFLLSEDVSMGKGVSVDGKKAMEYRGNSVA